MANRRPSPRPGNNPPRRDSNQRPKSRSGGPSQSRRPGPGPGQGQGPNQARGRQNAPQRDRDRDREGVEDGLERLQKVLAHAGVSSRRACEELILQGRITVDGQTVRELGTKVDPRKQQVAVDGQKVHSERNVYYAVHKPKGYVSTNSDPAGKPRVVDLLPEIPQRVYCVGRLDEQSTGLLLMTNDGELANKLAHPKFGVEKVYRVVVAGEPGREILDQLTQGIWLAEGKVRAKRVRITGHKGQASILEMVLAEGKNREIRRMLAKLGHKVMSLTRIAVGPVGLKGLGVGECRPLSGQEIDLLRKVAAGLILPSPRFPDRRDRTPRPQGKRPAGRPAGAENTGGREPGPRPRPEGRDSSGPGRPQRPAASGSYSRPAQGQRPGAGRPQRPGDNQAPRSAQGQGSGPRRPQRPGDNNQNNQGPRPGADRRPPRPVSPAQGSGPRPPRPPVSQDDAPPLRRIIGLDPQPAPRRPGPTGPRLHRPGPKRPPRASFGMNRPPKPKASDDE